ncbi:UPF0149 family protein [Oceanicoccus sp. KOV_DT_Chl]|uniref:UPF0149 family protein n=1 Tax=Oceanicoccus sp. KOV_DT_Chl TaxID=1904639 RepID=UPI000C7B7048|nr:UPF0149 family protein [Oceanicoccus sp. KOV_DT_Chl]
MSPVITMPEFDQLADIYWRLGVMQSPAQLQGYWVGRLAVGDSVEPEQCLAQTTTFIDAVEPPNQQEGPVLLSLYGACQSQLSADAMDLQLLMPDDEADIGQRIDSVGQWCQGFMAGFAQGGKQIQLSKGQQQYSQEVTEALSDMAAISQISLSDEDDDAEQREQNIVEIIEYLRVAAITIYLDCNKAVIAGAGADVTLQAAPDSQAMSSPSTLFAPKNKDKNKLH